jgi:transposase-like protein
MMTMEAMPAPRAENRSAGYCPKCRVGTLVRVEHESGSRGRSYDRFFCPRCGSSVEVIGDGTGDSDRS